MSTNVIPGLVTFSMDVGAPEDELRLMAVQDIWRGFKGLEKARAV